MNDTETINMIIGFCISADNNMTIADRQNNILNLKKLAQNFTLTDYQIDIVTQGIDLLENEIAEEILINDTKHYQSQNLQTF